MAKYCFYLRVKPQKIDEYIERHRCVWPDMLNALRESGWNNYSLFLREDGLLIGYVEAEDIDAAQAAMSCLEVNSRWQKGMAEFFEDSNGQRPDESFQLLENVFDLDQQLAKAEECDTKIE